MESYKILLADPSEPVRKVIINAFEDEDFELITADDYDRAVEMIAVESPALILAGISLPGKDGYALCEYVKGKDLLIPVVMLVGTDETLDSEEALRVGADDYFIRPFKSQDLIEKISDLLASSSSDTHPFGEDKSAPARPLHIQPDISDTPDISDIGDSTLADVDMPVSAELSEPASYGEVPSLDPEVETLELPEEHEVDHPIEGLPDSDISESSDAFLAELGIEDSEDEDLDIVIPDTQSEEESKSDVLELDAEEEDDMLNEFLSEIDDGSIDDILPDKTEIDEALINEIETSAAVEEISAIVEEVKAPAVEFDELGDNELLTGETETSAVVEEISAVVEEVEAPIEEIDEVSADAVSADEISFNDDAIIEESETVEDLPGVDTGVEEKGAAVGGIVEISKSKIEELIINNTKEDIKNIAYELVPGLAKDPIAVIVPEATKKAAERLVGEIVKETTAQVAEGIIREIAAEITSEKAAKYIAQIAREAVTKAAEERIREIAEEAARSAANEIISSLAEKTTIDAAERLITGEIKSFKTKLSKED